MILNIYKDKGWTSADVVAKVKGMLGDKKRKVGHAGTLDPLAEGVLIVLTDGDTKRQAGFMDMEKEYIAEISFGAESPTYDLEGELYLHVVPPDLEIEKRVDGLLPKYTGEISQQVPPYSALKKGGVPLYKSARKKRLRDEELPRKKIHIYELEKLDYRIKNNLPTIKIRIRCSKGTYIRSLAHDMGQDLGVGGVLVELTRTRIGKYKVEEAVRLSDLKV